MNVKERINLFIEYKNISVKQFEEICSLSNGYISSMRKSFGTEKLDNVLCAYPDLNREWLLYGEGEMLRPEYKTENNSGVSNVTGNGNRIKNEVTTPTTLDPTIDKILKEMSEERKAHATQVDKLLAQLEVQNRLIEKLMDK